MCSEANLASNGQSLGGDEGKAPSARPPGACGMHHAGNAACVPLLAHRGGTPESELIQCLSPGGLVLQQVTGVQRARLPFPTRCLISQNSFY